MIRLFHAGTCLLFLAAQACGPGQQSQTTGAGPTSLRQFDLDCRGRIQALTNGVENWSVWRVRYSVDLAGGMYCRFLGDHCEAPRPIARIDGDNIFLADDLDISLGAGSLVSLNPKSGLLRLRARDDGLDVASFGEARCTSIPFTPFS